MTANSTTIITSRGRTALAPVSRMVRLIAAMARIVRTRWNDMAQAGQMGPGRETEIGRHTGARI